MKPLKIFGLACACAVVMTFTAAVTSGGVDETPVISPGNDTAEVSNVIMKETGGCTIIFSLDGHAVNIEEPSLEKCETYEPGETVKF